MNEISPDILAALSNESTQEAAFDNVPVGNFFNYRPAEEKVSNLDEVVRQQRLESIAYNRLNRPQDIVSYVHPGSRETLNSFIRAEESALSTGDEWPLNELTYLDNYSNSFHHQVRSAKQATKDLKRY